MLKILNTYKNGNYHVIICDDGTKIRYMKQIDIDDNIEDFNPEFPENIDICISKKCNVGCKFCYESATPNGEHASLDKLSAFIEKLHSGTEVAIGGGGLSTLPEGYLLHVASCAKIAGVIMNITVNQKELLDADFLNLVKSLLTKKLIYGLGISFCQPSKTLEELNEEFPNNIVIHTINGITTKEDYEYLAANDFKILILGYKTFGRGKLYDLAFSDQIKEHQEYLNNNVLDLVSKARLISFDNLALEQLDLKSKLSPEKWEEVFMGNDGCFTMYIDAVNELFGVNSIQPRDTCEHFSLEKSTPEQIFRKIKLMKEKILG